VPLDAEHPRGPNYSALRDGSQELTARTAARESNSGRLTDSDRSFCAQTRKHPPSGRDRKRIENSSTEKTAGGAGWSRSGGAKKGPCLTDAAPEAAPDRAVRVKSRYAAARTCAVAILAAICPGGTMPISTARWPHRRYGRRTASAWSSVHS